MLSISIVPNSGGGVSSFRTSRVRFRETVIPAPRIPSRIPTTSRLKRRIFSLRLSPRAWFTVSCSFLSSSLPLLRMRVQANRFSARGARGQEVASVGYDADRLYSDSYDPGYKHRCAQSFFRVLPPLDHWQWHRCSPYLFIERSTFCRFLLAGYF